MSNLRPLSAHWGVTPEQVADALDRFDDASLAIAEARKPEFRAPFSYRGVTVLPGFQPNPRDAASDRA